jgi:hypothetical protein
VSTRTTRPAPRQHRSRTPKHYRRALERLEALPENQSGADKTWVEQAMADWHAHYARAVRVR